MLLKPRIACVETEDGLDEHAVIGIFEERIGSCRARQPLRPVRGQAVIVTPTAVDPLTTEMPSGIAVLFPILIRVLVVERARRAVAVLVAPHRATSCVNP